MPSMYSGVGYVPTGRTPGVSGSGAAVAVVRTDSKVRMGVCLRRALCPASKPGLPLCGLGTLWARLAHRLSVNREVCGIRCASGCVKKAAGAGACGSEVERV